MTGKGVNFQLKATDQTRAAFNNVQKNIKNTNGLQRSWNAGLNSNRRAVQQFGFQMTDFAVQIAGGQNAMLAFTQQGGQMLQFFGPLGAIMAALLAVFGSLFIAFQRSGAALSSLTPIMGVLAEDFKAIGRGLIQVKEILIDFANLVVNNLDRIIITAGVVVGWFGVKMVAAFIAAKLATMTFAGALLFLRGALIRTGIGALIIAAGELAYQFTRLVKGAGGFGNAMVLLKNVAVEVWERIGTGISIIPAAMRSGAAKMKHWFVANIRDMLQTFTDFTWAVAGGLNELFGTSLSGMGSELNDQLWDLENAAGAAAGNAALEMEDLIKAFGAPLESIQALRDAMNAADKDGKEIDIRDWFGGKDDDDKKGGKDKTLEEKAKTIKKAFDEMADGISGSLKTAFGSLLDKTKSVKDIVLDLLADIMNRVASAIMNPIWDALGKSIATAFMGTPSGVSFGGGILSNLLNGVMSFDGGGETWKGARSGGLDGKGGRLVMAHSNERIIDNTKGGSGGETTLEVHIHENAAEQTEVKQSNGRVDVFLRKQVSEMARGGALDAAMRDRYGVRAKAAGM